MATDLARKLLELLPEAPDSEEEVRAVLQPLWDLARHDLSGIELSEDDFLARVAERLPAGACVDTLPSLQVTDLLLAGACERGDPAAVRLFESRYGTLIDATAMRVCRDADLAQEVGQQVRMKLLVAGDRPARIASYLGQAPLAAWVAVTTTRTALSALRSRGRMKDVPDDEAIEEVAPIDEDPELAYLRSTYKAHFKEAFRDALRSLSSKDRNLLRYYLVDELNIDRIGVIYGVHRATVARWIAAARQDLYQKTRDYLLSRLDVDSAQFESILRIVRSQLDMSIARHLEASRTNGPK